MATYYIDKLLCGKTVVLTPDELLVAAKALTWGLEVNSYNVGCVLVRLLPDRITEVNKYWESMLAALLRNRRARCSEAFSLWALSKAPNGSYWQQGYIHLRSKGVFVPIRGAEVTIFTNLVTYTEVIVVEVDDKTFSVYDYTTDSIYTLITSQCTEVKT